jgi:hypothetical protein
VGAVATDIELQQSINRLLRKMHLTAAHHVYAVIDEDDDAWRTPEGHYACPICGHHL